jgi:hypothetical protein
MSIQEERKKLAEKQRNLDARQTELRRQEAILHAREVDASISRLSDEVRELEQLAEAASAERQELEVRLARTKEEEKTRWEEFRTRSQALDGARDEIRGGVPQRYTYLSDSGEFVVIYGDAEFAAHIEEQRARKITQNLAGYQPTTHGSSNFNRKWSACGRHSCVEGPTRWAVKLLEANRLSVPPGYRAALEPSSDCYSG